MAKKKQLETKFIRIPDCKVQVCLHFYDSSPLVTWTCSIVHEPHLVRSRLGAGVEADETELAKLIALWEDAGITVIGQRRTSEDRWVGPKPWRFFKRFRGIRQILGEK